MLVYHGSGPRRYDLKPIRFGCRRNWEFQAVLRGAIAPILADDSAPTGTSCLWVFPPETGHGWTGPSGSAAEVSVFHFHEPPPALAGWVRETGWRRVDLHRRDHRSVRELSRIAQGHILAPTVFSSTHFAIVLHRLCELILAHLDEPPLPRGEALTRHRCDTAVAWYRANLHLQPDVAAVAAAVHLSPAHLRRVFHAARGDSPRHILRGVQLQRARELLVADDAPLSVVAAASGFRSLEVFSRCFVRHLGTSPGRWRRWRQAGPHYREE